MSAQMNNLNFNSPEFEEVKNTSKMYQKMTASTAKTFHDMVSDSIQAKRKTQQSKKTAIFVHKN